MLAFSNGKTPVKELPQTVHVLQVYPWIRQHRQTTDHTDGRMACINLTASIHTTCPANLTSGLMTNIIW